MHKPRARARIDAPMHLARRTLSDARITTLFLRLSIHPSHPPFYLSRVLVHPSFPLISTQIRDLLFAFLSLFLAAFFPTFHFFPLSRIFASLYTSSHTSPHLFREIPSFLAYSLRDPLKSFSLCASRNSFS